MDGARTFLIQINLFFKFWLIPSLEGARAIQGEAQEGFLMFAV